MGYGPYFLTVNAPMHRLRCCDMKSGSRPAAAFNSGIGCPEKTSCGARVVALSD
jgi:hypothetical protein